MISLNTKTVYKHNPFVKDIISSIRSKYASAVLGTPSTMVKEKKGRKNKE